MKKIGLISDTHAYIDPSVFKYFEKVDEIWHAGDIGSEEVSDRLAAFKPYKAVYGNIDGGKLRTMHPKNLHFMCERVKVFMTHIGGPALKYNEEVRKQILEQSPALFICGHSHILKVIFDKKFNMLYMNPGAAGIHGFHKVKTLLRFSVDEDKIKDLEVIELGHRSSSH